MKDNAKNLTFEGNASGELTPVLAEAITIPAGGAEAVVEFQMQKFPIRQADGGGIGGLGDTSLVLTSTAFTNEVAFNTPDGDLADGDYYVNYITGHGRGKKADASVSMTGDYIIAVSTTPGSSSTGDTPTGTDGGTPTLAIRDDELSTLSVAEGKFANLFVNALGAIWTAWADRLDTGNDEVAIKFIEGVEIGDGTLVSSLQIATGPGKLIGYWVTNTSAATVYYQVQDANSLPADATIPALPSIPVPAGTSIVIDLRSFDGFEYTDGCILYASSTVDDKTLTAATSQIYAWKE